MVVTYDNTWKDMKVAIEVDVAHVNGSLVGIFGDIVRG